MNATTTASRVKVVAVAAAASLTLVACSSDDPEPAADQGQTSAAQETQDPSGSFTNDTCEEGQTSRNAYKAGGILPLSGGLDHLAPPEVAGIGLAISDINAAGGVGNRAGCHQIVDAGDVTDLSVARSGARELIAAEPSVVVGAGSSSVSLDLVDRFARNKIVQISPASTATRLDGASPFYFRTVASDEVQGSALGTLVTSDGAKKVGFLVAKDVSGTGLRNVVQQSVKAAGTQCGYGCRGDGAELKPGRKKLTGDVSAVTKAKPDAIVVVASEQTEPILTELADSGYDMSQVYLSGLNTRDYSDALDPGTLRGAKGTIPGGDPGDDFRERLSGWYEEATGDPLRDAAYGPEAYDATVLGALAAVRGGDTRPVTIRKNLAAVSGANGGATCTSYEECVALLGKDRKIRYAGPSGIGPLDDDNDPSSALVGIYEFDAGNRNQLASTVESASQQ